MNESLYERDGVDLEGWLLRLVGDDPAERTAAGEALQAMEMGIPSVHTDLSTVTFPADPDTHRAGLRDTYKAALAQDDFDTGEFLRRLVALDAACSAQFEARMERRFAADERLGARYELLAERVAANIRAASSDASREHQVDRLANLTRIYICSALERDEDEDAAFSAAWQVPSMAIHRLLEWTDREFRAAPDAFDVLWSRSDRHAHGVLERMGPAASDRAPQLLEKIRTRTVVDDFVSPFARDAAILATICDGSPEIVGEMVDWLGGKSSSRRCTAAQFFAELGSDTGPRTDDVLERLEPMLALVDEYSYALPALASVGRERPEIRAEVRRWAAPRDEPLSTSNPESWAGTEYGFDLVMCERGTALTALGNFTDHPEECLPTLVEGLESFEEQDPDETYLGPHARIAQVLEHFGPAASPAAEPLARHIDNPDEDFARALVEALLAMGPGAAPALPHLEAYYRNLWEDDEEGWDEEHPEGKPTRRGDPVGWLILELGGETGF